MIRTLATLDIPDKAGKRAPFRCVALEDDECRLVVSFCGLLNNYEHYRYSHSFLENLKRSLPEGSFTCVVFDIMHLEGADDVGFHCLMDVANVVYDAIAAPVFICIRKGDKWQHAITSVFDCTDDQGKGMATIVDVEI